jgi:methyl-accepting chemotaxis protein
VVADLKNSLTNAFGDITAAIKSINDQVAELTKSLNTVSSDVANVTKEVADVKGNFNEFGKRVDAVEADTAFRKSGDLGEIVQFEPVMTQKSLWGGRFLKNADLLN